MSYTLDRIVRLSQPTVEPVTLAEAKEHLRFDGSEEDDYITALISVSRDYIENYTGRYFAQASFAIYLESFPGGYTPLDIAIPDTITLDELTYLDTDNAEQTISTGLTLDPERRHVRYSDTWPTDAISVRVEVTAGRDNSESPETTLLPFAIKQSILLVITDLYNNRASVTSMQTYQNKAVEMLAHPYRVRLGI